VFKVIDNVLKLVAVHRGERTAKKGFNGVNIGSRVPSILNHIKTGDLGHSKFILNSCDYYGMCHLFPVL